MDANNINLHMPDYFRPSTSVEAYKRGSQVLMKKMHNEFNDAFSGANNVQQMKADKVDANDTNSHIPQYFRSSTSIAADKRACQVITKKIHNEFSDLFWEFIV